MWIRSNLEFTFLFWSVSAPTCRVLRHRSTAGASGFPRHLPNIWNSAKMVIEWDCKIGDWDYIILHYSNMWQASTFNNHWRNLSQPSTARTKLSNAGRCFRLLLCHSFQKRWFHSQSSRWRGTQEWKIPQWHPMTSKVIISDLLYCSRMFISGWWFQTFFILHNIWDNPCQLTFIFFKRVKTTNQMWINQRSPMIPSNPNE